MDAQSRREWILSVAGAAAGAAAAGCVGRDRPVADVCVVGSGPAGAILATTLATRGIRTLLLEGGPNPVKRSREIPVGRTPATVGAPISYPVDGTRFLGEGGTSNLWGGECPRCQPVDFDRTDNPYIPADAPWPVSYAELEPYYQRAEEELTIAGADVTPVSPPRSRDFPHRLGVSEGARCLHDLLGTAGIAFERTPTSVTPRVVESHIPRIAKLPHAELRRNTRVTEIVVRQDGLVDHLIARNEDREAVSIHARDFVLACGGIETPRLLMRSRSSEFPQGIGNAHDLVGRHFMEHLAFDLGKLRLPAPLKCQEAASGISWQFSREFKQLGLGNAVFEFELDPADSSLSLAVIIEVRPSPDNRVRLSTTDSDAHGEGAADVTFAFSQNEDRTWRHAQDVVHRVASALRAQVVAPPAAEFGWTHHHMGTCRMGRDPRTSVVDSDLRVHGTQNLFVSGSAPFVTCGAGAPTLLLTALGQRLADHLTARNRT